MQVIQVNHIRLQTSQTVVTSSLDRFRATIDHPHLFAVTLDIDTLHAAFAGQDEATAVLGQDLADDALALTKAIQGRGVEKIHTFVQRC